MINILLLLFFLTCVGIVAAWVAENPGSVTIHWFDYRIDTSFGFLILLALLASIAIAYIYIMLRRVVLMSDYFSSRRGIRRYEKGLVELTYSVAALAASDIATAEQRTRKAEKILGQTPLTLMLSAQIARSQGNDAKTFVFLEKMLDHKETEYLAARSLSDFAASKKHLPTALALAKRAHGLNPQGIAKVISLQIRLGAWDQAIKAVEKSARKRKITRADMQRYKGLIYLQQGLQAQSAGQPESAVQAAKYCVRYAPAFTPAVIFSAKMLAASGLKAQALKLITRRWKTEPHQQLATMYCSLIASEPKPMQLKMVQKLASYRPEARESAMMIAETAVTARDWSLARKNLKLALAKYESVRACKLMSEVEQGESMDLEASAQWLSRSASAVADPSWVCENCSADTVEWSAHCPACGEFDTLQWKQRLLKFVGETTT